MNSLKMFVRITLVVLASFARAEAPQPATAVSEALARGKYLVTVAGCNDCHTPLKMTAEGPKPDMDRMLSGHPEQLAMPAGMFVSGLESDGADLFYAGGGTSGKVRAVRRPKAAA